ncbi:hypothetical protein FITA111629_11245 [Filibacter tadaridae]|uniref:Lipoprotein n=1 Tax=Filibacter tadaridae TaxID=2483811 RepID=A0A3P5XC97_9BACL|nr:hypothetical protein [Filibacter tadaridae]VDC25124.1 hypothetical protein FILTAD_01176 [Filibacter tadaridae]
MKKLLGVLFLAILLVGCNADDEQQKKGDEVNVEEDKGKQEEPALSMQLLKADEENGVTLEEEMYQQLAGLVEANPDIGVAEDFSVHAIDLVETATGEKVMLFLGINRLEKGIKDIKFDYTLGVETEGSVKYVFDRKEVELSESLAGVIQPNHAIPFTVPVTPEGQELLQLMTEENKVLKLENAKFDLEK